MEHFDKEGLMKRVKDNQTLLQKLLAIAKEDIPEEFENLKQIVAAREYTQIKGIAHSIKGTALNMGFNILADIALKLEKIEESAYSTIPELMKELEDELNAVLVTINEQ